MSWVATIVAAVGAIASYANQRSVAKKQDNVAAAGIRAQAENQRRANAKLNKALDDTAQSNPDGIRQSTQDAYLQQIQRARSQAHAGLQQRGISEQYDAMAGDAQGDAEAYAGNVASLLSRIDAGTLQRQQEGNTRVALGTEFDVEDGNVRGDAFLNGLLMQGVRRNPYLDAISGAASAYGKYGGGSGGGVGWNSGGAFNTKVDGGFGY
jgi:hypothetical protein